MDPRPPGTDPTPTNGARAPKPQIKFENPEVANLYKHIKMNATLGIPMVEHHCHADARGAVICGMGHSLETPSVLRKVRAAAKKGWLIFGIKMAITYLKEKGIKVREERASRHQGKRGAEHVSPRSLL